MKTYSFHAMGSKILIAMDTNDDHILSQAQEARYWFEEWEQCFSRFRISSELSKVNQRSGYPVKVSPLFSMWPPQLNESKKSLAE